MAFPQIGDNDDRAIELLEAILRAQGGTDPANGAEYNEGDTYAYHSYNQGPGYFSTGPDGIDIDEAGDNYREIEFGGQIGTINIRTDIDLFIAFDNPYNRTGILIPVSSGESPFTVGSSNPLGAEDLYIQKQNDGDADAEVHVIAY